MSWGPPCTAPPLRALLLLLLLQDLAVSQQNQPRGCGERSCYEVLGLDARASADDIKKAY
eukprot:SAG25_NODE_14482_length_254_cov_1.006452_1_plen_59_part_10